MLITSIILSFQIASSSTVNQSELPHPSPKKIRTSIPRNSRLSLSSFLQRKKSREISTHKREKPWNGHFSADNFIEKSENKLSLTTVKNALRQSIIALPKWHTKALEDIEVRNNGVNHSRGLASSSKMILQINHMESSPELISVFIHEMGHITDLGAIKGKNGQKTSFYDGKTPILSDDLSLNFYKLSWLNSQNKKLSATREDFVSGYATTDCFEDFAETYLFYRLHGDKFRGILSRSDILQKKYEFMKKYVFEEVEFQTEEPRNLNFNQYLFDATLLAFRQENL